MTICRLNVNRHFLNLFSYVIMSFIFVFVIVPITDYLLHILYIITVFWILIVLYDHIYRHVLLFVYISAWTSTSFLVCEKDFMLFFEAFIFCLIN